MLSGRVLLSVVLTGCVVPGATPPACVSSPAPLTYAGGPGVASLLLALFEAVLLHFMYFML